MKKLYTPLLFVFVILSVMMLCLSCDPNNTPKTFTVTYDANGGKGTLEPARKTAKEAIVIANADSLSQEKDSLFLIGTQEKMERALLMHQAIDMKKTRILHSMHNGKSYLKPLPILSLMN